ncbi:hypothetical protein A8924_5714 [Saccharopolyspora erythraea NRRL 2338]|uniref:Uncharacterized protein n=2 Tax=Saccharopolyspora erythraea TaxID=1836 RepID=A4FKJ5_SACEN|nr:hypothetical protein [Saccharopolyspora erythraea]EQD82267.1 hypothetical protein N599_31665 [Saccharopolyspora erythraea D]PFG98208.1 hypothetical protein A8924_5714 [Saccharopolyspora erythraea NRRL 2338]QRK88307.1 hypothetical protein JQX30_26985 [Saccharopolyspora erythraea]CAM04570.1 hypothetical protein SACE_5331 [Saccharopolyspora erythraea NRRL 2338]
MRYEQAPAWQEPEPPPSRYDDPDPYDYYDRDRDYDAPYDRESDRDWDRDWDRHDRERDRYERDRYDRDRDRDRYEPPPARYDRPERSYEEKRARRADRANTLAMVVHLFTGVVATVFVLHIVFQLFGANPDSGFVSFVYQTARIFVFGFGDVFTPGDATIGLVLNYGLAAAVYLVVGRVVAGALRRR